MRISKLLPVVLVAAITLIVTANANAVATVKFSAVGSSALWAAAAGAARLGNPGPPVHGDCGSNHWVQNSSASVIDTRSGSIPAQSGNLWVVWDGLADGSTATTICYYLSVDSVVGVRAFFARGPNAHIEFLNTWDNVASDDTKIPTLGAGVPMPPVIRAAIDGTTFNAGASDIRPEDAEYASRRMFANHGANPSLRPGLGYGLPPWTDVYSPGNPVSIAQGSFFSGSTVKAVDFSICFACKDPISGVTIGSWETLNVGGEPIVIFANNANAAAGGLGSLTAGPGSPFVFSNVGTYALTSIYDGKLDSTRDLGGVGAGVLPIVPIHAILRESLSGTMNTFEFSIPRSWVGQSSQENGITPQSCGPGVFPCATQNPLNLTGPNLGTRQRVVGTGQMVDVVGGFGGFAPGTDRIGYSFWGYGNFAHAASTSHYLALDGVDPLYADYGTHLGAIPTCPNPPGPPCPVIDFPHIKDGTYRAWSVLKIITASPTPAFITTLISHAQTQVVTSGLYDFVPVGAMQAFRSHRPTITGIGARNGHKAPLGFETGMEMGGGVFPIQADFDFVTNTGVELINFRQ